MRSVITNSGNGDYSPLELDLDNLDKKDSQF
jgi:hypothetical protein